MAERAGLWAEIGGSPPAANEVRMGALSDCGGRAKRDTALAGLTRPTPEMPSRRGTGTYFRSWPGHDSTTPCRKWVPVPEAPGLS